MLRPLSETGVVCVAFVALLSSCGSQDGSGADAGSGATPDPPAEIDERSVTPAPSTTAPRGPLGSGESVTLAFAGDASFQGLHQALQTDPRGLLAPIAPTLGAADVTMVNLEAALGSGGEPADKEFVFQVPEAALDALASGGVDVVTMANNHGMDHGIGGLLDSLRIRRDGGFAVIGIGEDAEDAYAPYVTEVRGQRIGFIAASDVIDDSLAAEWSATDGQPGLASVEEAFEDQFLIRVAALRTRVDTLVVYLHYGTELETCPNRRQRELVDRLSGAGADIVVGSHAHRLQGMGMSGDTYVAYGLSNFVFRSSGEGARSGVLNIAVTGRRIDGSLWSPARIEGGVPAAMSGEAADAERSAVADLRGCAGLSEVTTREVRDG